MLAIFGILLMVLCLIKAVGARQELKQPYGMLFVVKIGTTHSIIHQKKWITAGLNHSEAIACAKQMSYDHNFQWREVDYSRLRMGG